MATFPASIPAPLAPDSAPEFGLPTARPDLGFGYVPAQQLATRVRRTTSVVFELSRDQARDLVRFLRDHAADHFTLMLRLADESAEGVPALVKFAETKVAWRPRPFGYEVRARLEIEA